MTTVYTTVNGQILHEVRNGQEAYYRPDTLGNVIATTSTTGTVRSTHTYWPYGEVRASTGTNHSPFKYVGTLGYYADSATTLYVRARYYRPAQTRWMTVDPLWPKLRAFSYALGQPVKLVDPSGLFPWKLIKECGMEVIGIIRDIIAGGSSGANWCKIGTACLAGIIGFLAGLLIGGPVAGACIGGAIAGVLSALFEYMCDPPGPCEQRDLPCLLADGLIAGIVGCLGGLFGDTVVEQVINSIRSFLYGLISGQMGQNCTHQVFPADYHGLPPNVA